jgi:hypothetical protein
MPIDLPYLSEIDEFLKSEFPKDWLKNFRINETSAALVADISEKEISFSSKMTLAEKKLFKSFNHLILSGEYIYKEEALAKLQEIETTFNEIQAPQPSIVKIKDDEVRKKIDSYNDSISNSFINLFFNPIKHALTNVKSFVDHINDYSAYNNSEILFTFKLKSNIDNLDEDAEIYRDVLFININVATFDHMIAVDDYTLEHLIKANHTLLDNKYNSIKTESYYSLLVEKISFLIRKIIFRKEKEALKGETPLSKQIYYLDGEKRVIRPDDFKLSHNKSTEWESRFKNHYGDDHHYFISSEEIEKIKEKIITGKFREISIDDLHKAVKFFKDREKSTTFLEKIRIEYDKFYYEELKKTKCEFDKISLKINRNYIYNNEFSLFVDQNTDWHKIEDKLEKVVNIQEETSINNFFPFLKTVKWLSNHIEAELKEINLETIPLNLKRVEDLVSAYKKYVDKWEKNLKWCHLRDYLAFRLFKKDSTTPISLVNDIGEKAYDLFIASSFILPFNYDRKKRQLKEYKEKETQFISELVFYKNNFKKQ